ncbi:fumarate hydratase [Anoxybacter fermentans]|uniref:Fumarate hydratase n=1 Tax=Anoxybacter fermentans TaxID=1323375 RepID=A0A3S9SX70_9FIRM|nr:fumarate hydratase [Anoxybacter fermentans]AZR72885.1 fumarate hydratase [Anoxybacter fermentans]
MKIIKAETITREVARLCQEANFFLGEDVMNAFKKALEIEESEIGREILEQLIENAKIAKQKRVPMCQDTGYTVVFLEVGQDLRIEGNLEEAVQEGVRLGYAEGYLRKSIVEHPFRRRNTGDNTPAVIHTELVSGDNLKIIVAPKGGGSENMSKIKMLKPADGKEGVIDFVLQCVKEAGPNPCPPIVVGVGIGGTFEKAAYLAKKALLREIGSSHPDPEIAELEQILLQKINDLGIGPAGFGGVITALDVNIEIFPCHIASLPVAVNLNCHAARHKETVL